MAEVLILKLPTLIALMLSVPAQIITLTATRYWIPWSVSSRVSGCALLGMHSP
jgi:hypothetical protein